MSAYCGCVRARTTSPREQPVTLPLRRQLLEASERAFRHHAQSRLLVQQLQHLRSQVQNAQNLRDSRTRDTEPPGEVSPRLAALFHRVLPLSGDPYGVGSWRRLVLVGIPTWRQLFPREVVPLLAGPAFLAAIDPERDLDGQKNSGSVPERGANENICSIQLTHDTRAWPDSPRDDCSLRPPNLLMVVRQVIVF